VFIVFSSNLKFVTVYPCTRAVDAIAAKNEREKAVKIKAPLYFFIIFTSIKIKVIL